MKKKIFGILLLMETFFLSLTVAVSLYYGEQDFIPFSIASISACICGLLLFLPNRKEKGNLGRKDCYIIVSGIWVVFSIFGMIPFLLYGTVDNITDGFFETISGFTTTGATILSNIDEQPHGILFWRSLMQWLGGLGIMLFSIALLPSFNRNNKQLFSIEATSISVSKLRPKTQETARGIWIIYFILTVVCAIFFYAGPMNKFDAICHAMTTLGTGGFSTHQASFAFFNSAYLEYVCGIFMIMAGVNFSLYFFASTGNWKPFRTNEEFNWYIPATIIFILIFFILFLVNPSHIENVQMPTSWQESFRAAFFHVATIFSSCGFQGTYCDYVGWGDAFWIPTIILMISGACAGSSTGGVKLIRIIICIKNMRNEFLLHTHPNAVLPVKISKHVIPFEIGVRVLAFIFIFTVVFVIGTFLLSLTGISFDTAFGSCLTALSNSGPGFGSTGPCSNFADISPAAKWILSALMLIGRLEIYTVLLLFTKHFWKD